MKRQHRIALAALAVVALLTATGCTRVRMPDANATVQTLEETVHLAAAKKVIAQIRMGVGEMELDADAKKGDALDAEFTYAPATWKPVLESTTASDALRVQVRQPETSAHVFGETRNTWRIGVTPEVPTDLELELGVGTSKIDLSDVDVRDLRVISGVGEATVDLTGPRKEDVSVDIDAGVGRLVVKLPREVGVRVDGGENGLGNVTTTGLTKQGSTYVNDEWSKPGPKMSVRVTRGIGDLELLVQP